MVRLWQRQQDLVEAQPTEEKAKDPVCGMTVDRRSACYRRTNDGVEYVFCSERCHDKFVAKYVSSSHHHHVHAAPAAGAKPARDSSATAWTCPMHPEIRRDGPGSCPLCEMALERVVAALDDEPDES